MNKKSIVIDREYGSGGREVARILSEKLGIEFYDGNLLVMAGQEYGIDLSTLQTYDEKGVGGVLHDLSLVDPTGTEIDILNADCQADAEKVRDAIRAAYPQVGEISITQLGVVIGAHCGPGLLTVFYLCGGRRPE